MISIPVSFLLAAVFFGLGLWVFSWRLLPLLSRQLFLVLFCLMALEAVLVGVRFALGSFDFLAIQRVLPVWIAPSLYLAFAALTASDRDAYRQILLNGIIALGVSLAMFVPAPFHGYIDTLIAGSFAAYSAALFRVWCLGPDRLSEAPTILHGFLHKLLAVAVAAMIATLAIDIFIAFLFAHRMEQAAAVTVSLASLSFLVLAFVLVIVSLTARPRAGRRDGLGASRDEAHQEELIEAARSVLIDKGLYKDPALTLTRLARRVGVPDRDLSRAINQCFGGNVSQFVNRIRLDEAARLLAETDDPVTRIQEQVGFLTRSNFYKEFQKQFGDAPGVYRKNAQPSSARTVR